MGKSKKNNRSKSGRRKIRRLVQPVPATPVSPTLTLPDALTLEEIQKLQGLLEQRRVLIEFRDCDPGTLFIKRRNDPSNMEVGLQPGKFDTKLRLLIGVLISDSERDLVEIGIDLDELESEVDDDDDDGDGDGDDGSDGDGDGDGDDDEEDLATMLAEAHATLEKIKQRQAAATTTVPADDEDPEAPDDPED